MNDDTTVRETKKGKRGFRSHNWCFTSFEPDPPGFCEEKFRYMCYQREIAPSTLKSHIQGYVECIDAETLPSLKRFIGENVHLEPRKGSQQQAIDYCKKSETAVPGSFREFGRKAQQGSRSDLDNIWEFARQGATSLEMMYTFKGNGLRHLGVFQRAQEALFGYNAMDAKLLYNRAENKDLGDDHPYHIPHGRERILVRNHREYLEETFYDPLPENATEVLGNTSPTLLKDQPD